MSLTSGPINEGEQAAERVTDHAVPDVKQILDYLFQKIWKTRIFLTIDVEERKDGQ
jgi:hypothetical protein